MISLSIDANKNFAILTDIECVSPTERMSLTTRPVEPTVRVSEFPLLFQTL